MQTRSHTFCCIWSGYTCTLFAQTCLTQHLGYKKYKMDSFHACLVKHYKVLHCNFNMLNLGCAWPRSGTRVKHYIFYLSIERKNNANRKTWLTMKRFRLFPFWALYRLRLGCCESESTLNWACLLILSYTAVYNHDTYAHVSWASVSNVGMSFIMLIIKQHLHLKIATWKIFNNGYRKYWNLLSTNSVNATENDSAKSVKCSQKWLDWLAIFSFSCPGTHNMFFMEKSEKYFPDTPSYLELCYQTIKQTQSELTDRMSCSNL